MREIAMSFTESASPLSTPPENWYVGRAYFYSIDPDALLTAGYDRLKVFRRKQHQGAWEEITTPETRIPIESGKRNYSYLDNRALKTWQYMPALADSNNVLPDVMQPSYVQDALDTSFEAILTIQELKDRNCWGLLDLFQDSNGNPFPDRFYAHYIRAGIATFEHNTRLFVQPTACEDLQHYIPNDQFTIQLDQFPVLSVEEVSLNLPGSDPIVFPADWLRIDKQLGKIWVVPTNTQLPAMLRTAFYDVGRMLPQGIRVKYTAGFAPGRLPADVLDVISKESSFGALNLGGDLVGGAAIASQSVSLDGLSQSVNTTSSPTMAGFGARLINYKAELKKAYAALTAFYRGVRLYVG